MSTGYKVLKFSRTDAEKGFVIVQVKSKGSRPLDIKLLGTDEDAAYVSILRQDRASSLKASQCPLSDDEWQAILEDIFEQRHHSGIQATATVETGKSITITIRKEIQGFTQRLGSIVLSNDDKAVGQVNLFDWCAVALDAASEVRTSLSTATGRDEKLKADIKNLNVQLEELIQAKDSDEIILLTKFRDLLNEKKLKIREQQKVIATLSQNAERPLSSHHEASPPPLSVPAPARKAAASRGGKRKVAAKATEDDIDEASDSGRMDVDIKVEPEDSDPGNTTAETASTAGDDTDSDADASTGPSSRIRAQPSPPTKKVANPPPRRNLPFNHKKAPASTAATGSETDSDDEL